MKDKNRFTNLAMWCRLTIKHFKVAYGTIMLRENPDIRRGGSYGRGS
jgi:hypothetical protein